MAIWLNGWTGDNAGPIIGRQNYRALISLTHTDGSWPVALIQKGDLEGTPWYFNITAVNLAPDSMYAIVTDVDDLGGYVYSLTVKPWQFSNTPHGEWQPGVNLFSIMMLGGGGSQSGTIASVIVPTKKAQAVRPFKFSEFSASQVLQRRRDG